MLDKPETIEQRRARLERLFREGIAELELQVALSDQLPPAMREKVERVMFAAKPEPWVMLDKVKRAVDLVPYLEALPPAPGEQIAHGCTAVGPAALHPDYSVERGGVRRWECTGLGEIT